MEITSGMKYRTRMATNRLIGRGLLNPSGACEVCGGSPPLFIHHMDYVNPLDVIWLCRSCHVNIHRECGTLGRPKSKKQSKFVNFRITPELEAELKGYSGGGMSLADVVRIAISQSIAARMAAKARNQNSGNAKPAP